MGVSLKALGKKVKTHSERRQSGEIKGLSSESLLAWYDKHRRAMPWRAEKGQKPDPYKVWLSEIMLQQTTVATVGPYFGKFIARWPTLRALAAAELDDILRLWAGLGYYRRARLLHQCACRVVKEFDGHFPQEETALLSLPGFGPYTAAAVSAIAYGKPANVVDGNVERVMARIFCIADPLPKAKAKLRAAAQKLVPEKRCGDYAQGLMDLGATICTPRAPKCALCPWKSSCKALAEGLQETLPRREKTKAKPVRHTVAFVLLNGKGEILLRRRPASGLLAGMMEVPSSPWIEGKKVSFSEACAKAPSVEKWERCPGVVRHVFSHFTLEIIVTVARTEAKKRGYWAAQDELENEALPSVMRKIIRHALEPDFASRKIFASPRNFLANS